MTTVMWVLNRFILDDGAESDIQNFFLRCDFLLE